MKPRYTLEELIYRSAGRLQDADERLKQKTSITKKSDAFLEYFLLKESSILARLAFKYWLRLRIASIKRKLSRK